MLAFWIVLILLATFITWAGWRQKRYGGTKVYDPRTEGANHKLDSSHNPWGKPRAPSDPEEPR
jgi:ABC-type cobalt transport system substrate-binding protein